MATDDADDVTTMPGWYTDAALIARAIDDATARAMRDIDSAIERASTDIARAMGQAARDADAGRDGAEAIAVALAVADDVSNAIDDAAMRTVDVIGNAGAGALAALKAGARDEFDRELVALRAERGAE